MVADQTNVRAPPTLLGLRAPADLADRSPSGQKTSAEAVGRDLPDRPTMQVISSGYNSEDDSGRGKSSDLMTAISAGIALLVVLAGIGLLLG